MGGFDTRQLDSYIGKHQRLPEAIRIEAGKALEKVVTHYQREAQRGIKRPPKTGRVYTWRGAKAGERADSMLMLNGVLVPVVNRAKPHQASAPGEYPAHDQGDLIQAFSTRVDKLRLRGTISNNAAHAAFLQYGTKRMDPRPFMDLAIKDTADYARRQFGFVVRRAMKRVRLL